MKPNAFNVHLNSPKKCMCGASIETVKEGQLSDVGLWFNCICRSTLFVKLADIRAWVAQAEKELNIENEENDKLSIYRFIEGKWQFIGKKKHKGEIK